MAKGDPFDFGSQINVKAGMGKAKKALKVALVVIILMVVVAFKPWVIVDPGYRGVLIRLGDVVPGPLGPGIHAIIPMVDNVVQMEVRINKEESSAAAASKDLQNITTKVAVNFHPDPTTVDKLYDQVGPNYGSRIIDPAVQEVVKAVSARYTAEELITERPQVKDLIKEHLTNRLATHYILVDDISITDFDFSRSFNDAIEAKQVAEQNVQKAQRDLQRIKVEAEQKVTQAKAEAEALRLQKREISAELLKLREIENQRLAIQKWNGVLPQVTGENTPLINVGK